MGTTDRTFTAFAGHRRIAAGEGDAVAATALAALQAGESRVLVFDDRTGEQVDLDPRTGQLAVAGLPADTTPRGRGRPKLGVTAREITLLPRHWDWLARQPGGASAALRRLVEDASRKPTNQAREARDAVYKVMTILGGNLPGYEEATRALFAGDAGRLAEVIAAWPPDIRAYLARFMESAAT